MRFRFFSERGSIQSALAIPLVIAMLAAIGSIVKIYVPFSNESAASAAIAAVANGLGNIATSSASGINYYIDTSDLGESRARNIAKAMSVSLPAEFASCVYGVDVKSVGGNTQATTQLVVSSEPTLSCPDLQENLIESGKQLYDSRRDKANLPLIAFAVIQKSDSKFIDGMIRVASANPSVREIQMASASAGGSGAGAGGLGGVGGVGGPGGLPGAWPPPPPPPPPGTTTPPWTRPPDPTTPPPFTRPTDPTEPTAAGPTTPSEECLAGTVWSKVSQRCVPVTDSSDSTSPGQVTSDSNGFGTVNLDPPSGPPITSTFVTSLILDTWTPSPAGSGNYSSRGVEYNSLNQTFSIPSAEGKEPYKLDPGNGSGAVLINTTTGVRVPLAGLADLLGLNNGADLPR